MNKQLTSVLLATSLPPQEHKENDSFEMHAFSVATFAKWTTIMKIRLLGLAGQASKQGAQVRQPPLSSPADCVFGHCCCEQQQQ